MNIIIHGNLFRIMIGENELSDRLLTITLPDGYSLETIHITNLSNILGFNKAVSIKNDQRYTFPAVDSKSPCKFTLTIADLTKASDFGFIIEKFGQIPDSQYFDKAFEPILVTGDDGNEYPVIPSDQFK